MSILPHHMNFAFFFQTMCIGVKRNYMSIKVIFHDLTEHGAYDKLLH